MTWVSQDAWITIAVLAVQLGLLMATRIGPDIVFLAGLTVLLTTGVLDASQALGGLANEGMVTVGVLYVVVAGLRETGAIRWLGGGLFGYPRNRYGALARILGVVPCVSAFLNNTPIVAMLMPVVDDWARMSRLSVSKLMMPLSYAAILGGMCTLVGTSTNLVVNGLLIRETGGPGLGMFDVAWVGVPCALGGGLYILVFSRWLLPDRRPPISRLDDPRSYTVEMVVDPDGPLVDRSIEEANLRHLPSTYLAEIERQGELMPAVAPHEKLRGGDRLVFVGIVESVVDLMKIRGLLPATEQVFKLDAPPTHRCLIEAVVSNSCPVLGKTIRDGRFRSTYNAVVVAVARNGERVNKKIGDIALQPGDTLLLDTHPSFVDQQRNSRDFFLVSRVENSTPLRTERAFVAVAILVAMVVLVSFDLMSMLNAAMLAAGAMIVTRCCTGPIARRSIDWQVLIVIAAAFGLGTAVATSGLAEGVAQGLIGLAGDDPRWALAILYLATMFFTEVMTNNAAAVLMFPIAMATSERLNVDFTPFVIVTMIAASASFATPIGYQTNLMVYGPGGYRYSDYLRFGAPLNLLVGAITVTLAPLVWPLSRLTP